MSEQAEGPHNATFVPVEQYSVASWRDGPVGSDVPVSAVVLLLSLPAVVLGLAAVNVKLEGDVELGLRIKSRAAAQQLIRVLSEYTDEVWPLP